MDKVDDKYIKAFNLGYEIAKELKLKKPLFKNQNTQEANNPIQAGMLQFIKENPLTKHKSLDNDKERVSNKNNGKGLTL